MNIKNPKISCIQFDMRFCEPDENFIRVRKLITDAASDGADIIVLPETWNTGFFPREDLPSLCDTDGQRTKSEIGALAKQLGVNIVAGSVSNLKNGKVYNTAYVFGRDGKVVAEYDKTHLFTPMDEHKYFEKGDHTCRFTLDGLNCGIIICYDVRFPELTRTMTVEGVDILFVVSQWPLVRKEHLYTLTKARAIENQMFLACCNSCGRANETVYGGGSVIFDPWGNQLAKADETETVISAECDMSVVNGIRTSINVFADRRPELYNL